MKEGQAEVTRLTSVQLLDAAIWREIGSEEPQAAQAFPDALARLVGRWLLIRSTETLTRCHLYMLLWPLSAAAVVIFREVNFAAPLKRVLLQLQLILLHLFPRRLLRGPIAIKS